MCIGSTCYLICFDAIHYVRRPIMEAKKTLENIRPPHYYNNIYYSIQSENNKGDGRKTWRTMDNLLHKKSSKSIPDAIIVEDKLATDKGKIADAFNKYFATVCMTNENANQNLPQYDEYLKNPTDASFNFERVENTAVLHFINKLKPSHSCGCDKISSNILKIIAKEVSPCITLIINQTLIRKTAKFIPV